MASLAAVAHAAFAESLRAGRIGGRYLVDRVLGQGGMGLVVSARYPDLDQLVAIKILLPELAQNAVLSARFLREAKLAARFESPHLVRVFDVGRLDNGAPYMVMELLSGTDLGKALAERGRLPVTEAVDILLQAIAGIAHLHASGVVHRDLKPSNVFLARGRGGTMTVKILDFGVSKEQSDGVTPGLTATDCTLGTPQYMSPEQVKDSKRVDLRSDIWSLGVILYEILAGGLPFSPDGDSAGAQFGAILYTEPIPIESWRQDLPAELTETIMRCLRRAPEQRFASVAELAAALTPFAGPTTANRLEEIRRTLTSVRPPPVEVPSEDVAPVDDGSGWGAASGPSRVASSETVAQGFGSSLRVHAESTPPATSVGQGASTGWARASRAIVPAFVAVFATVAVGAMVWLAYGPESPQQGRAGVLAVTSSSGADARSASAAGPAVTIATTATASSSATVERGASEAPALSSARVVQRASAVVTQRVFHAPPPPSSTVRGIASPSASASGVRLARDRGI